MRLAAERCRELIVVNTATRSGHPDGLLAIESESTTMVLSGTHGLNWLPTGPQVVERMLRWMGFVDTRLLWWTKDTGDGTGRLEIVASKQPGLL